MNQIQVVGTHNSYHLEPTDKEKARIKKALRLLSIVGSSAGLDVNIEDIYYSHEPLETQLKEQRVRAFELDIFADPSGGNYEVPLITGMPMGPEYKTNATKVLHIPDVDVHTVCTTLTACLGVIKSFLKANPRTLPIPILIELSKSNELIANLGRSKPIPWNNITLLDRLDYEIRSVFTREQLITPDDIRYPNMTLDESIRKYGWPNVDSAKGKVIFLMDNEPNDDVTLKYIEGRPSLEGRVLFTNSKPGRPDCAFQKVTWPSGFF
ncbi:histone lysine methyltransferase Set9 [Metarhizium acridum]|nr:histone lysine methyltransferase Set9 [Metarhizium acridum]